MKNGQKIKVLDYYFNHTLSGKYSKHKEYYKKKLDKLLKQLKKECFDSKRPDRTREVANEINSRNREINITFEQCLKEEATREYETKRDNDTFYSEMKSLGCLHNCGLED